MGSRAHAFEGKLDDELRSAGHGLPAQRAAVDRRLYFERLSESAESDTPDQREARVLRLDLYGPDQCRARPAVRVQRLEATPRQRLRVLCATAYSRKCPAAADHFQ